MGMLFPCSEIHASDSVRQQSPEGVLETVTLDYKEFFSTYRVMRLGIALGASGLAAGTGFDEKIRNWYQDHVRDRTADHVAGKFRDFGNGFYIVSLSLVSAVLGNFLSSNEEASALGTWGERTLRAIIVGGPPLIFLKHAIGSSRPGDNNGSRWRPFQDDNSVSGHAFIGAVPFLTLARMYNDTWYVKYALFAASALPALSRIHDNTSFPSQAALGWFLAWAATSSIFERDNGKEKFKVVPMITAGGVGIKAVWEW